MALILNSGAILTEARSRTLSTLLATPITPARIVMGKLSASLLQLLLLLVISLPLLAMVRVLGGVDWMFLVATLCVTTTGMFLMGSMAARFSVTSSDPLWAMAKTLFWYAILCLAPVLWASPTYVLWQLHSDMLAAKPWTLVGNLSLVAALPGGAGDDAGDGAMERQVAAARVPGGRGAGGGRLGAAGGGGHPRSRRGRDACTWPRGDCHRPLVTTARLPAIAVRCRGTNMALRLSSAPAAAGPPTAG